MPRTTKAATAQDDATRDPQGRDRRPDGDGRAEEPADAAQDARPSAAAAAERTPERRRAELGGRLYRTRGQPAALAIVARAVARERPPHALLIAGPTRVGKTTLALDLAAGLLCLAD